jgi:Mg-chelatase subunit ChlD
MVPYMARISDALNSLMDNKTGQIEDSDRIALITFAKNSNRVFSLVEKNQNFQQLKNQF